MVRIEPSCWERSMKESSIIIEASAYGSGTRSLYSFAEEPCDPG